ncbi:helix-turn-helix domain-containing protein [Agilicoccus flavus]|uniref:helix-turn-helix domain-containing protein n=1 Tax=Agilicoccus flavus TaxID=2775968 RepID=UPI001CF66925|nr:helix-turn-helix domain-containing protein [Agilicoccus flavus]
MSSPGAGRARDDIERAHLRDPADASFSIARAGVADDLRDLARRFWIPVWDVGPGEQAPQRVLQYPVCLVVVSAEYARFYGVVSGLSTTTLTGRGWAVGLMLQPAAGRLLTGRPVSEYTDRHVDLQEVADLGVLTGRIRQIMGPDPSDPDAQCRARGLVEDALRPHLPVDCEGRLVNAIVEAVEGDASIRRVGQVCAAFDLTERSLQRLTRRRLGLSPAWLIRRRRLHEAADRLRDGDVDLAGLAHDLGYADQAHLTRDWRAVTGTTPGAFAARFR